jgi:FkbM family methyltransferase
MDAHNVVALYKQHFTESPSTILDFGSHDLRDSLILADAFPDAKIYAFEANPELYEDCVLRNIHPDRISVSRNAISNKNEQIKFYLTPGNIGASSMLKPIDWVPWTSDNRTIEILADAVRLDSWLPNQNILAVDLVWMDVQGAELLCLEGMGEYLHTTKMIQSEVGVQAYYEGHTLYPEIDAFLLSNGFLQLFRQNDWSYEDNVVYVNTRYL